MDSFRGRNSGFFNGVWTRFFSVKEVCDDDEIVGIRKKDGLRVTIMVAKLKEIFGGGGEGSVSSVANVKPDSKGDVPLRASHLNVYTKEEVDSTKLAMSTFKNKIYGTDTSGNQIVYDRALFGLVDDVLVGGTSCMSENVALLGTMAGEEVSDYYTKQGADLAFGSKLDDVLVGNLSVVANKVAMLKSMALEEASDYTKKTIADNLYAAKGLEAVVSTLGVRMTTIEDVIPSAASSNNELADKAFVNSTVQNMASNYVTANANEDSFDSFADLSSGPYFYQGTSYSPTKNDYAFVKTDETHNNVSSRYMYNGVSWSYQYSLNNTSFTQAQINAINSGITAAKVSAYDTHINATGNVHGLAKGDIGLGSVDNTADANKIVAQAAKLGANNVGSATLPIYLNGGTPTALTQANLRKGVFGANAIGTAVRPIYIAADGVPTLCTYSLNATVPSGAVFTDTNYYPTSFSWTNGTSAGPVGSLAMVGMAAISFPAIPAAASNTSGIVTTGAQTFGGVKTFADNPLVTATQSTDANAVVKYGTLANERNKIREFTDKNSVSGTTNLATLNPFVGGTTNALVTASGNISFTCSAIATAFGSNSLCTMVIENGTTAKIVVDFLAMVGVNFIFMDDSTNPLFEIEADMYGEFSFMMITSTLISVKGYVQNN